LSGSSAKAQSFGADYIIPNYLCHEELAKLIFQ